MRANLARLMAYRERHERGARLAVEVLHMQQALRASLQLLIAWLHFIVAGLLLALLLVQAWAQASWLALIGLFLLATLMLLGTEQIIEALVNRQPESWAVRLAWFVRGVISVFSPFILPFMVLNQGENENRNGAASVTEDELKILVDASQQEGVLEREEREMIYSIFRLGDTLAREIMVPRIYINALDVTMPLDQVVKAVLESAHSRLPVYEETIDHIVGLVYARDLLSLMQSPGQAKTLRDLLREAYFVPEAKKVDELLDEMQSQRIHMAIVIDEYGGVAGLVTLEDIVEEIVGEIRDEYDQAEEIPIQQVGEGEYLFLGRVDLDEINELLGTALDKSEAETIGGFMYSQFGRVPSSGESILLENYVFTAEQVVGKRIRKVRARKAAPAVDGEESEENVD